MITRARESGKTAVRKGERRTGGLERKAGGKHSCIGTGKMIPKD